MLSVNWSGTLKDKWFPSNEILIEIGSNGTNNRSWKRAVLPRQLSTVRVPYFYFLSLFFAFFLFFPSFFVFLFSTSVGAKSDLRYLWERPTVREAPAFHLQLDQPRQTIDRLSRVLRLRQRSASRHCSSWTRAIIRIPNHPMNQRRYPACIYVYLQDWRFTVRSSLLRRSCMDHVGHVGWSVRLCKSFLYLSTMAVTCWPDTRARNSRNPNATGKLPSKNPTLEFHWTKCHHRVLTWTRRNGSWWRSDFGDPSCTFRYTRLLPPLTFVIALWIFQCRVIESWRGHDNLSRKNRKMDLKLWIPF